MSVVITSVEKINALKTGIEAATGESYNDLTEAVQGLKNGYKQGGSSDEALKAVIEGNTTEIILPNSINKIGAYKFYGEKNLVNVQAAGVTSIGDSAFANCTKLAITELPAGLTNIESRAFLSCTGLTTITFKTRPANYLASNAFEDCINLKVINVPWAEGEVSGAPWGATNATINYNYTGG